MSEEEPGYPSDKADKVLVRMPDGMRDRIKVAAKASNRTMNAEIVARLEESFAVRNEAFMQEMAAAMRRESEASTSIARQELMIRSYETQLKMVRHRLDKEARLVEHLEFLLDASLQRGDADDAARIEAQISEERRWMAATEMEQKHLVASLQEATETLQFFLKAQAAGDQN
ncbi:Arc family DNA-binding protein [Delftia deserti]|uniref:Arc family DNA-binding protein n=1 Tax=Delftia deserti TaxID=1651218 RepID=A0ABW5EV18_9BURK